MAIQDDNRKFNTTAELANQRNSLNDFSGAAALWINYAATTPSKNHKNAAHIRAAGQYVAGRQFQQAIEQCKQAEGVSGVTFEEAEVAATAYSAMGDKQNAIKYYNDAIRLFPNSIVDRGATIASFRRAVQQLQDSP